MSKCYLSAPLPFQGQKRMFAREFKNVLKQFPDTATYVDLFGGSGLLSHIVKHEKPNATVVYNDFDGYRKRLAHIPQTNELLAQLRLILNDYPRGKAIIGEHRQRVLQCIEEYQVRYGYIDYVTLSSSIMFAMHYKQSLNEMRRETLYNRIRQTDYLLCNDYLEGLTIVSADYKQIFHQYKDVPGVVFLVDPPYLSTDCKTYKMYWKLADYLDVLHVLHGHRFIYFTSNKSSIIELCDWMGKNRNLGNPFEGCTKTTFNAHTNFNATYTDMMLYSNTI